MGDDSVFGNAVITLMFDPATFDLRQWTIKDPKGKETSVMVFNVAEECRDSGEAFRVQRTGNPPRPVRRQEPRLNPLYRWTAGGEPISTLALRADCLPFSGVDALKMEPTRQCRFRSPPGTSIPCACGRGSSRNSWRITSRTSCACRKSSARTTSFPARRFASLAMSIRRCTARRAITASPSSRAGQSSKAVPAISATWATAAM